MNEDRILAAALEAGHDAPESIAEAPDVRLDLSFYFEAYLHLSTTRPAGFGPRPIPWTAIQAYAEAHEFDDPDEFRAIIARTDAIVLEAIEEQEQRAKAAEGSAHD